MKKIAAITLVLLLTVSLCGCRFGRNKNNDKETEGATTPTVTTPKATDPVVEPTQMDPMETNIPDPNVDDDHLVDPTGEGIVDDAARSITRRINGLS